MGKGCDAAGAFEGRGDDDFEATGTGAQGEFGAGEQAALAGRFEDESAHRWVAEEGRIEQMDRFVDGEREGGGRLQAGEQGWIGVGQRLFQAVDG